MSLRALLTSHRHRCGHAALHIAHLILENPHPEECVCSVCRGDKEQKTDSNVIL